MVRLLLLLVRLALALAYPVSTLVIVLGHPSSDMVLRLWGTALLGLTLSLFWLAVAHSGPKHAS